MSMVEGLQNPVINIKMDDFGYSESNICFGCAATNTVCKISNKTFTPDSIYHRSDRADFINTDHTFLAQFEHAIDSLRSGKISRQFPRTLTPLPTAPS